MKKNAVTPISNVETSDKFSEAANKNIDSNNKSKKDKIENLSVDKIDSSFQTFHEHLLNTACILHIYIPALFEFSIRGKQSRQYFFVYHAFVFKDTQKCVF